MTDLTIIKQNGGAYIDSREVAEVIGKAHKNLLRDIAVYTAYMEKSIKLNFEPNDFFLESTYVDSIGRTLPCYLLTKMGCELVANKLTGEKGVLFTVAYVKRFNELEAAERAELEARAAMPAPRLGEYNACARIVIRALRELGTMPEDIILFLRSLYQPLGIEIAADTVIEMDVEPEPRQPRSYTAKQIAELLGIYSTTGNPHAQAVSCILNDNIFIGEAHKTAVSIDCGDHTGVSVRYDEYAVRSVMEWIAEYNFPDEVYGFGRTYYVRYDR
jgi:Rha family phage regulatory protein